MRKPKEAAQDKDTPGDKPRDKVSRGKRGKAAPERDTPGGGAAAGAPAVEGDTPTADVEAAFGLKDATRATKEEVVYLDLSELHAFKDHPFKVREDAEMQSLVESVKTGGVNQPALVRPREGGGYEIIAGHRRQKASELAGFRNKQNAPMIAGGITPRQTKFETNKEKLRQTIRKALATAASFDEFSSLLLREGVTVKESQGRLSYLTPDRTKPITARKLGDDFDRAAVLAVLEQNAARATEKTAAIPEYPRRGKTGIQPTKAPQSAPKQDGVQRLVDIEQKMAEGKGKGYEHWAKIHNIKQMAKTLNVYQQYGFTSPEQLEAAFDTAYEEMRQTSGELKTLETKLQGKKELQRQVLAYAKTKPVRDGLKAQKSPKAREAYRQAHESDFIIADAAARYFKAHGITRLPARKALQDEIEQLVSKKSGLYNTYHEQKQRFKELQTVKRNIDQILRREEPRRRKEQSHER